ncbi:MAG: T9SS type A sorting domain-containing protein [Candidatus Cloacimonetes bacterium]|nr:T9SS type A sorting domain-containing protein [Candidatus Cloacimonadota bacterium]
MWNGTDSNEKAVSSGIYFYQISTAQETQMKKMLLLK